MTKKPTLEQWREMGRLCRRIHEDMVHLQVLLGNAHGKSKPESAQLDRADKAFDKVRSALDNLSARALDDQDWRGLFYGPADKESGTK